MDHCTHTQLFDDNSIYTAEVSFIQSTIAERVAVAKRAAADAPAVWGGGASSDAVGNRVGKYLITICYMQSLMTMTSKPPILLE